MFITNCHFCDQPITSESEAEQTGFGLTHVGKCLDKTKEMEEDMRKHEEEEAKKIYTEEDLKAEFLKAFRLGQSSYAGGYSDTYIKDTLFNIGRELK